MRESVTQLRKRAAEAAARVLNDHWVDEFGECPLPVDATRVAELAGADVFTADLSHEPGNLSGFVYIPPKGDGSPQITINSEDHIHRRRFTCAHELGHTLDVRSDHSEHGFVDRRDDLASHGTDPREIFANAFASTLLMPSDEVEYLATELDVYSLARKFKVSTEAMVNRLSVLGIRARD